MVSLTAISYKILEGIIKQVTCQLLEMVITRNHDAKLTYHFLKNTVFWRMGSLRNAIGVIVLILDWYL